MLQSLEKVIAGFRYEVDVRRPPDEYRRRQFRAGWEDATKRNRVYAPTTLEQLTWRNTGYRLGRKLGDADPETIDGAFDHLANSYVSREAQVRSEPVLNWAPRTNEDHLLQRYHEQVGGTIYVEVPIGGPGGMGDWPAESSIRRLDGVRLVQPDGVELQVLRHRPNRSLFLEELEAAAEVEIIEVKSSLNRLVIGQAIAGADMFKRQYLVDPKPVIVVGVGDKALEWVCEERDIHVAIV
jgi:hypothetical protein